MIEPTTKNKPIESFDSIDNALSELSLSEDVLNQSLGDAPAKGTFSSSLSELITQSTVAPSVVPTATPTTSVPPNAVNIENFYKELQRYEKIVNGLTTKTLNGTTPLEIKWKELMDLLDKDAGKRTVVVSKLFPEKNRNMLSVPYDHSRVLLPTATDNYINAAHVRVSIQNICTNEFG